MNGFPSIMSFIVKSVAEHAVTTVRKSLVFAGFVFKNEMNEMRNLGETEA